jgi:hypothetical protein
MGCINCGNSNTLNASIVVSTECPDTFGCTGTCADFTIRRHDTLPVFKVSVEDCDGPLDLDEDTTIVETSMWAKAKLKTAITAGDTFFSLADDIGFEQVMINDIIIMDRVRAPEHMLVTAFDEDNKLIQVQRGYNGTVACGWKKGTGMRIFRVLNSPASLELVRQDIVNVDGSTTTGVLTDTFLIYAWDMQDTCLPGCYYFEFKILKEIETPAPTFHAMSASSIIPSFSPSNTEYFCSAEGIEWIRRFPQTGEGFLINIVDSPTTEMF